MMSVAVSCGKKDEPGAAPTSPTNSADSSQTGSGTTATPSEQDVIIAERSMDFIKGRIEQKDYQSARASISTLETQPMTPAQRQRLAALKAQLPKN